MALEQLEVALGDREPGLDRQPFVAKRLAESRHLAVGADHHGHLADEFQRARFAERDRVDVLHADLVAEERFDDGLGGVEIARRRFLGRLQQERAGEHAAMGQRLFQANRLALARGRGDLDRHRVAVVRRVAIGIDHSQVQPLAEIQLLDRPRIGVVRAIELPVLDQPGLGRVHLRHAVRPPLVVVGRGDQVLAADVQRPGDGGGGIRSSGRRRLLDHRSAQQSRQPGGQRHQVRASGPAQLQEHLADEPAFGQGVVVARTLLVRREDAADVQFHALAGGQGDEHRAFGVLGRIRIDHLDGQRAGQRDLADVAALRGPPVA